MRIALDAMGGDLAPKATVEGAVMAARDLGLDIVLIGDRELITRELAVHNAHSLPIRIEHAAEVVGMDDSPLESILTKPDSSMHSGFDMLKRGEVDAFVSAGNSGAMMTAAMMILGTLPGVDRPAIGTLVPTANGVALLIDAGANTEVKPLNLVQFAIMGSVYSARVRHVARPRVGILSNGEEPSKGTDLTRAAAATLYSISSMITYIGYVEGRDINRGKADVIVTDGFTGNVALKTMEGTGALILGRFRELFSGSLRGKVAYLLVRGRLAAIRLHLDPSEYGGAPLLGVNGISIVAHGSSSPQAIRNAIRAAAGEAQVRTLNQEMADLIARAGSAVPARAPGKGFRAMFSRMRGRLQRHREADRKPAPSAIYELPSSAPAISPEPQPAGLATTPAEEYTPRQDIRQDTDTRQDWGQDTADQTDADIRSAEANDERSDTASAEPAERAAEAGSKHDDEDIRNGSGEPAIKAASNGRLSDSLPPWPDAAAGNHVAPAPSAEKNGDGDSRAQSPPNHETDGRSLSAALGFAHGDAPAEGQPPRPKPNPPRKG